MMIGMPFAASLHSLWVEGVLPLAHDNEQSVQQRCAELVREAVVDRVITWHEAGDVARLERPGGGGGGEGGGPVSVLLAEHSAADTLLVRELNASTGDAIVTSSLVLLRDSDGAPAELLQTAHELSQGSGGAGGGVGGVQMWRMVPMASAASESEGEEPHDEEAFMYSGSEL